MIVVRYGVTSPLDGQEVRVCTLNFGSIGKAAEFAADLVFVLVGGLPRGANAWSDREFKVSRTKPRHDWSDAQTGYFVTVKHWSLGDTTVGGRMRGSRGEG